MQLINPSVATPATRASQVISRESIPKGRIVGDDEEAWATVSSSFEEGLVRLQTPVLDEA